MLVTAAGTFLFKKEKTSPASYSLKGVLQERSLSHSLVSSRHNQHPVAWNATGMSNSSWHILILPEAPLAAWACLMLPVTSQALSLHRNTRCLIRYRICQKLPLKQHIFHEQFCSSRSECPFIYKGRKKSICSPPQGNTVDRSYIAEQKSLIVPLTRGTLVFAEITSLSYFPGVWGTILFQWYQYWQIIYPRACRALCCSL